MYDIHSHIIYGIDDGSPNEESSRELLSMAVATGTRHIIATPHVIEQHDHPAWEEILSRTQELQGFAKEQKLELDIYPGAETMLSLDTLAIYDEAPQAFCLNSTKYALVELPMYQVPRYTEDVFYEMQLRGLVPVLAHPERYNELFVTKQNKERLLDWCHSGVLLQANGGSIVGKFGAEAQKNLELLLHNRLISFIGSDAHRVKRRNTNLTDERQRLYDLCDEAYANTIIKHNPKALLANEAITIAVPKKLEELPKPSFWGSVAKRIFG